MSAARRSRLPDISPSWQLIAAITALMSIESARIPLGSFSLAIGQVFCLVLLFFAVTRGWVLRVLLSRCLVFGALFCLLALPSIVHFGVDRAVLPLQFLVNVLCFVVIASAATRLRGPDLDRAISSIVVLLVIFAAFGLLFLEVSGEVNTEPRLLGIPRMSAFFTEPTWLAIMTAGLACIAIQRRLHKTRAGASALVLGLWTRAALVLGIGGWLAELGRTRRVPRLVPLAAVAVFWAFATYQFAVWVTTTPSSNSRAVVSTLSQRAWDIAATKEANNGQFFPYGGKELEVFDVYRDREIPSTSNVLPFDLVWKLGLGGAAMMVALCFFFLGTIPTTLRLRLWEFVLQPAAMVFLMILPVCVFNNGFGRPWLWAVFGLAYASLVHEFDPTRSGWELQMSAGRPDEDALLRERLAASESQV
jgi:hypothetical protein